MKQQCDGAVVYMLSTAQLPWLYLNVCWQRRIVELSHGGEAVFGTLAHELMHLGEKLRVLKIRQQKGKNRMLGL